MDVKMNALGLAEFDLSLDSDSPFTESFRERSNTWPLRPNRVELEPQNGGSPATEEQTDAVTVKQEKDTLGLTAKKSGARRNAWGNISYAELITKAIQSSPEKRLTLAQIYVWMVDNVPYFKDKGDNNSSAGWKNSIRHNLSLHNRFMRIQNEGSGKSSWWVINPDAKPGKLPRRRAGSMETKSAEKKRIRAKKRSEAARAALCENGNSSLNGSIDFLELDPTMENFRTRADSNTSSIGRSSPLQPDLHDNQVPPMSPIPWDAETESISGMYPGSEQTFPELENSLAAVMQLSSQESIDMAENVSSHDAYSGVCQDFNNSSQNYDGQNETNQFSHLPAPPPYPDRSSPAVTVSPTQSSPMIISEQSTFSGNYANLRRTLMNGYTKPSEMYTQTASLMNHMNSPTQLSVNTQQQSVSSPEGAQQNCSSPQTLTSLLSPQIRHASPQEERSSSSHQLSPQRQQQQQPLLGTSDQGVIPSSQVQQQSVLQKQLTNSILRSALTLGPNVYNQPTTTTAQFTQVRISPAVSSTANININTNLLNQGLSPQCQIQQLQQQQQQQLQQQQTQQLQLSTCSNSFSSQLNETANRECVMDNVISFSSNLTNGNNILPLDIDLDCSSLMSLDCDTIEAIKQDLRLEGNLDINFENIPTV